MKKIISTLLILALCVSFPVSAYAETIPPESTSLSSVGSTIQPRSEDTTWYWRNNNGNLEKRLWSNTYGKWLTDWIYVGPAP